MQSYNLFLPSQNFYTFFFFFYIIFDFFYHFVFSMPFIAVFLFHSFFLD